MTHFELKLSFLTFNILRRPCSMIWLMILENGILKPKTSNFKPNLQSQPETPSLNTHFRT